MKPKATGRGDRTRSADWNACLDSCTICLSLHASSINATRHNTALRRMPGEVSSETRRPASEGLLKVDTHPTGRDGLARGSLHQVMAHGGLVLGRPLREEFGIMRAARDNRRQHNDRHDSLEHLRASLRGVGVATHGQIRDCDSSWEMLRRRLMGRAGDALKARVIIACRSLLRVLISSYGEIAAVPS